MAGCGCFRPRQQQLQHHLSWRLHFQRPSRRVTQQQRHTQQLRHEPLTEQLRLQHNQSQDTQQSPGKSSLPSFSFFRIFTFINSIPKDPLSFLSSLIMPWRLSLIILINFKFFHNYWVKSFENNYSFFQF